ncbi:hypothetical protein NKI19_29845 [Mesorhizobium sp. M0751]
MMELLDLELARARQRLNRAERSLERANEMLDEGCGVGINMALCSRIRAAKRRVAEAKLRLTKIKPDQLAARTSSQGLSLLADSLAANEVHLVAERIEVRSEPGRLGYRAKPASKSIAGRSTASAPSVLR